MPPEPWLREAVRAVILDADDRILLVRFTFTDKQFWATPGGGIEAGESLLAALDRELREEVGALDLTGSAPIWTRTHLMEMSDGYDGQRETYFLVRVDHQELSPTFTVDELRAEHVTATAWWTPTELAGSVADFAPSRLPELVREVIDGRAPQEPYDVGV